jgi:transcriptional regulator with XRE-family HTH domain
MLSSNIATARKTKGLSQKQLATLLNVSRVAVYNWEEGKCNPTVANLVKIAKECGTTVDALISRRKRAA